MPDLTRGSIFAGHRIEGIAGRGGMGTVYRATHLALDHVVALKVIAVDLASDDTFRERFRAETRVAVSLRHPNVVPIHHAGEEDGLLFVTMDLIDGPDLRRLLIKGGVLEPDRATRLIGQVASALDVAHSRGLVHRDIKPGNVLIEQREEGEHAYLTDFGLAKRFDQASQASGLTGTGAFVGTLDYVAPEQIRGEHVDARTDVYALGCVLYEVLAGRPPFAAREENVAKIYAHLQDEPPWLPGEEAGDLDEVIGRALAKTPGDRFPSAGDLARAATAAASGIQPSLGERSVATGTAAPRTPVEVQPLPDTVETAGPPPTGPPTEALSEPEVPGPSTGTQPIPTEPVVRRPWLLFFGVGGVFAIVIAAVLALSGGGGDGGGGSAAVPSDGGGSGTATTATTGVPFLDPLQVKVPGFPVGLAIHDHVISIATREGQRMYTVDKVTRKQSALPLDLPGQAEDVAVAGGSAWLTLFQRGSVFRVPLDDRGMPSGEEGQEIQVGDEPRGIVASDGSIWVADVGGGDVVQLNTDGGEINRFDLGAALPTGIAFDGSMVWVSDRRGNAIRIDPAVPGGDPQSFHVGDNPKGIAVGAGSVWVANTDSGTVSRLDPATGDPQADPIDVGPSPRGLAFGLGGKVWVAIGGAEGMANGYVSEIDPATNVATKVPIPDASPEEVAIGPQRLWVTTGATDSLAAVCPSKDACAEAAP